MTDLPPRPPRRRMLPSVSDVVKELGYVSNADPAILFKVARQVCADELTRVKQGFESEPLDVLVERAKGFLDPSTVKPSQPLGDGGPAPFDDEDGDSPFESTAAMDLKWDPRGGVFSDPAPHVEEHTVSERTEFVPLEAPVPDEGPGESTLARLRRDADSVPLSDMMTQATRLGGPPAEPRWDPSPEPDPVPAVSEAAPPEAAPWRVEPASTVPPPASFRAPEGEIFSSEKPVRSAGLWTALALLVVIGGAIWLALRKSPSFKRPETGDEPASVSVAAQPTRAVEEEPTPVPPAPTPEPTVSKARPTPVPRNRPTVAPEARPATAPPPAVIATVPPALSATPAAPRPAVAAGAGRVARIVSPDWTGKDPIYVIHFSSYKDRPSAEKEARSLGGRLDHPGYAIQVELGEKGTWYRVLIGDFESADEARAYRAELEAKRTPNMGFVYRLEGR